MRGLLTCRYRFLLPGCLICILCTQALASDTLLSRNTPFVQHIEVVTLAQDDTAATVIPFTRVGNLIVVQARADTMEGNFILDTGAPYLVLNITYFRDYPQWQHSGTQQTSMTGATESVAKTLVKQFSFGPLGYARLDADLADLGHIENSKGIRILGLLGMELFRQCEMIIDYDKNLIYLHKIGRKEAVTYRHQLLNDTTAYHSFPIALTDNRIIVHTKMAGRKLRFVIDCAAESNVLSSKLPNKIYDHVTITGRVVLRGVGNRKVEALYGELKDMTIGHHNLGTMPMLITNLENTCFAYAGCIDGILGFDFLSVRRVGFNFVKRKMYIWK